MKDLNTAQLEALCNEAVEYSAEEFSENHIVDFENRGFTYAQFKYNGHLLEIFFCRSESGFFRVVLQDFSTGDYVMLFTENSLWEKWESKAFKYIVTNKFGIVN